MHKYLCKINIDLLIFELYSNSMIIYEIKKIFVAYPLLHIAEIVYVPRKLEWNIKLV